MECLVHHEEHEGHEGAGAKVVFFRSFMPFMVKSPSVNQGKTWNFCRWPEEEGERYSFTGIALSSVKISF
jgi:hypothetical protein